MRTRVPAPPASIALVIAGLTAALIAGCHGSTPATPVTPTKVAQPVTMVVQPVTLTIFGPANMEPGQSAAFKAIASLTDGSKPDYTTKVFWSSSSTTILAVTPAGEAVAQGAGDAILHAYLLPVSGQPPSSGQACCNAQVDVLVLPPNTFRLVGNVLESGFGLQGARVTVTSGIGAGLSTTTDYSGHYGLYGVAGAIEVTVTKAGYDPLVKTISVASNDVLDFPEAHQTAPLPSLTGPYMLLLAADASCPTTSIRGYPPLPADARQTQNAAVALIQDGPSLSVTLQGTAVLPQDDHFTGRIFPGTIQFAIGSGYYGYSPEDGVSIQISPTSVLTYSGSAQASIQTGNVITGNFNGAIEEFDGPGTSAKLVGECSSPNHQFTLVPADRPARRSRR